MYTQQRALYKEILEKFITSADFLPAINDSTTAGFGGSGYSVELFEDGTWRTLWNNSIGNLYQSTGIILPLPTWRDADWAAWEETGEEPEDYDGEIAEDLRTRFAEYGWPDEDEIVAVTDFYQNQFDTAYYADLSDGRTLFISNTQWETTIGDCAAWYREVEGLNDTAALTQARADWDDPNLWIAEILPNVPDTAAGLITRVTAHE